MNRAATPPAARWSPVAAAVVAAAAVAGLLWPVLSGAAYLAAPDYLAQFVPYLDFATRHMKAEGTLPLRLPHLFGGMPFLASMNTAVLYPTEWIGWLGGLSATRFYGLDAVIHHGLAAAGAAALFAFEGVGAFGSCAGGILYSLAGVTLTQLGVGSVNFHRGGAWLPALVLAIRGGCRGRPGYALAGGLIAGMMCLTFAVQLLAFGLIWSIALCLADPPREWRGLVKGLVVAGGIGLAIGAVWWMPAAEYWGDSTRRAPPEGFGSTWAIRPRDLMGLFRTPVPAGAPAPGEPDTPARMSIAVGGLGLGLAALGGVLRWRRRGAWLAAGVLAVAFSLGPAVFPGSLLARLPGFSGFRGWSRWMQPAMIAIALLAAEGFEALLRAGLRSGRSRAWPWRVLAGFVIAGMCGELVRGARPFISITPMAKLAIADAVGDFLAARPGIFRTQSEEDDRRISWRIPRDLEFMSGHHTIPARPIFRYAMTAVQSGNPYPYLGRMNCRYVVTAEPRTHSSLTLLKTLRDSAGASRWVYAIRSAHDRVYSVRMHVAARSEQEALRRTLTSRRGFDGVVLEGHPEPVGKYEPVIVGNIRASAGQVSADATTRGRSLVVIAEIADSGWRISLDGIRCMGWRADGLYMAVAVPPGVHRLAVSYDPILFRVGLWISLMAAATVTILLLYRRPEDSRNI